jgi:hypothetical protein
MEVVLGEVGINLSNVAEGHGTSYGHFLGSTIRAYHKV